MGWDANDTWTESKYKFNPGDMFFLYTDGLTEATNESGEEFGEARLQALLTEPAEPVQIVEKIFSFHLETVIV